MFLETGLPIFTTLNVKLQRQQCTTNSSCKKVSGFFFSWIYFFMGLVRFLQPIAISNFSSSDVTKTDFFKSSHQKLDKDLLIGAKTKAYLRESNISEEVKEIFFIM